MKLVTLKRTVKNQVKQSSYFKSDLHTAGVNCQGCAKLTDFEWIFGYDFENFRNFRFWLRFRIRIHYFDTFGCDFE